MLIIQQARIEDKLDVFLLAKSLATSFYVDSKAFDVSFDRVFNDPKEVVFIAKQGHNTVGYCLGSIHTSFFANGEIAWLEELYVKHEYRRSRVGHKLVSTFEEWSVELDAKLITLSTRRARNFYKAIGYEESATYFKKMLSVNDY